MNTAQETILNGLLNRYEAISKACFAVRQQDELDRVRGRIMDVIASGYQEENLPDVLHVTHGHRIYRLDYIEGRFDLIGTLTVDLSMTITPAIEVN